MKSTLEIPDLVFRRAKSAAAARGIPLCEFVTEAVKDKLAIHTGEKPWVSLVGKLKHLHKETLRVNRLFDEDCEKIDPEMRPINVQPASAYSERRAAREESTRHRRGDGK
jgi:hypothetical protein